jgi:hypothetical protein
VHFIFKLFNNSGVPMRPFWLSLSSVSVFLLVLNSCSEAKYNLTLEKIKKMEDRRSPASSSNILRVKASFVLNSINKHAYLILDKVQMHSYFDAKNIWKNYSCENESQYCSLCINLEKLSMDCDDSLEKPSLMNNYAFIDSQDVILTEHRVKASKYLLKEIHFSGKSADYVYALAQVVKLKTTKNISYKYSDSSASKNGRILCKQEKNSTNCSVSLSLNRVESF